MLRTKRLSVMLLATVCRVGSCLCRNRSHSTRFYRALTHSSPLRARSVTAENRTDNLRGASRVWERVIGVESSWTSRVLCRHCSSGSSADELPAHQKVVLPALSPTMESGSIISWEKSEGEHVAEGDLLAEVETDKATMGFECSDEGYLAKILVPAGTKDIPLGRLLCIIVENKEDVAKFESYVPEEGDVAVALSETPQESVPQAPPTPAESVPPPEPSPAQPAPPPTSLGQTAAVMASPRARRLAAERGVELARVAAGSDGIIRGEHVLATPSSAPAPAAPIPQASFTDLEITGMRKTIAKRLLLSKQTVPHYYLTVDVCMDAVTAARESLNSQLAATTTGGKISFNDFVIKAAAMACVRVPEANSAWMDTYIRQYSSVDISVAVSTEHGLITPIVFGAEKRGLADIGATVRELAARARQRQLAPHEFQGGTFSVSNLGMFGVSHFSAIINPPQACILAVGATQSRAVPGDVSRGTRVMSVTLSCDHRVVDGAVGARWLAEFRKLMEEPLSMIL